MTLLSHIISLCKGPSGGHSYMLEKNIDAVTIQGRLRGASDRENFIESLCGILRSFNNLEEDLHHVR